MNEFTTSLISILFFIGIGQLAKYLKIFDTDNARKIYKFLFTIPLPFLVFTSLANSSVEGKFLFLPLIGGVVAISLVAISYVIGKLLRFERKKLGTLMTAAGITSTLSFALPFIAVFYGLEATKYLFLYDLGGAIIVWTFVYYVSGKMGNKSTYNLSRSLFTLFKNPMLWALIGGLLAALVGVDMPEIINTLSIRVGNFTSPMILIGIGVFLNLDFFRQRENLQKILIGIIITMGISLTIAYLLTLLFGVEGIVQKVVLISALAPSGALTVPFAAEHDLDTDYASALVAGTMFFAILIVPILISL